MRNKELVLLLGVVFLIGTMFVIRAQPIIDEEVLVELNDTTWVSVTITLIDLGNKSLNIISQSEIISNFTENEFTLSWKSSGGRGFAGNITQKGIEKLENNSNILRVYLPISGSTTEFICGDGICDNGENCTTCPTDCGKCKEIVSLASNLWFWIIIILFMIGLVIIYLIKRRSKLKNKKSSQN